MSVCQRDPLEREVTCPSEQTSQRVMKKFRLLTVILDRVSPTVVGVDVMVAADAGARGLSLKCRTSRLRARRRRFYHRQRFISQRHCSSISTHVGVIMHREPANIAVYLVPFTYSPALHSAPMKQHRTHHLFTFTVMFRAELLC